MPQSSRIFLFLIQFLSYLWYFSVFLVIVPWLVVNLGQALDFLLFTYFLKINLQDLALVLPFLGPLLKILAVLFGGAGLALIIWSHQILSVEGSSFPFSVIAHKDLQPQKLATRGPYAHVRHPMLLGYLLWLIGVSLFFGTTLAIFWVVPLLGSLLLEYLFLTEEKHLQAWFGEDYQAYRATTPSLIPRWK